MRLIDFELRGEHIPLDALLKATGLAGSGGEAKMLVQSGKVQVDGQPELRRTAKLHAGQVVAVTGTRVKLVAPAAGSGAAAAPG
jgi:ribosome-associated protein